MNKWRFTEYMEKAGYNQKTFAAELGISKNTLWNKLNGRSCFDTKQVIQICEKLHIVNNSDKCEIFLSQSSQNRDKTNAS